MNILNRGSAFTVMQPIISVSHIGFYRRRKPVLQDISLNLYSHEIVALIGDNGTGKTTLLEIIAGILTPERGTLHFDMTLPLFWLGYLPDKAPLYPDWRVREFLECCAAMREVTEVPAAVERVIESCRLQNVATALCRQLSHGYRQRVGLAQALVHTPPVVILDEPTNGLDPGQKYSLRPLLAGLKNSCTVFMSSHDWDEVLTIADRIYYLAAGVLHEIIVPKRDCPQIWAASATTDSARRIAGTHGITDGRFVGFSYDGSADARRKLWQTLAKNEAVNALYPSYPSIALQEKLDGVA